MSDLKSLTIETKVRQKDRRLPVYLEIPATKVKPWSLYGTATVLVNVSGNDAGRRSIKKWDDNRWFIELTKSFCSKHSIEVGTVVSVTIERTTDDLPVELATVLDTNRSARDAWEQLSPSRKRIIREHIMAAKKPETRERRASAWLPDDAEPEFPDGSRLKRALNPMPDYVRDELLERDLMAAFENRPPYQRNDYLGWIARAKRPETRAKRLAQMIDELTSGDRYMKMEYKAKR